MTFQKRLTLESLFQMLVSQAEFARMKSVTSAAVSQWKREARLVIVGKMIDVDATERRLQTESRFRSKRVKPASADTVKPRSSLNTSELTAAPLADYPASMSAMATGCAGDLAVILLRQGMPRERVRGVVEEWLTTARRSATTLLEDDLEPPPGFERWADHPAFREDWLDSTSWAELKAEAALPRETGG
jgi:hypothetical protein